MKRYIIEESPFSYFVTADTRIAWVWFLVRLYIGWEWLSAGWEKFNDPTWVGAHAGTALTGFIQGALSKTTGAHPDVQGWYASFLQNFVLPHVVTWSYFVTAGELLVGAALILGFLVGISAFFGIFMNLNFMLAGSVSINPIMYTLGIGLILAWRVAGYWGADYYVLPMLHNYFRPRRHGA
jgi:thiosulfate dehydrogenase [quinone] large subunit